MITHTVTNMAFRSIGRAFKPCAITPPPTTVTRRVVKVPVRPLGQCAPLSRCAVFPHIDPAPTDTDVELGEGSLPDNDTLPQIFSYTEAEDSKCVRRTYHNRKAYSLIPFRFCGMTLWIVSGGCVLFYRDNRTDEFTFIGDSTADLLDDIRVKYRLVDVAPAKVAPQVKPAKVAPQVKPAKVAPSQVVCWKCHGFGHMKKNCVQAKRQNVFCWTCHRTGHQKKNCPTNA